MTRSGPLISARRAILRLGSVLAAGLATAGTIMGATSTGSNVGVRIVDIQTVGWGERDYQAWPTIARLADGRLILNYTGGKVAHNCPFGRVEIMRSLDEGVTWSWPQVVYDGVLDDRGVGLVQTKRGTLLAAVYTTEPPVELAPENADRLTKDLPDGWRSVLSPVASPWRQALAHLNAKQRANESGGWILRSSDGGLTWSPRSRVFVRSWHGPLETSRGNLLYAGVDLSGANPHRLQVCKSSDDGLSWEPIAHLPLPAGAPSAEFDGPHVVECSDGTLLCQMRRLQPGDGAGEVYQSKSTDDGRTWSVALKIDVKGAPTHLLRLVDGRILMSYALRTAPLGPRARVSRDHGKTWSEPIILSNDTESSDLGFTSSAELADGTILSVWYERTLVGPYARLRQARWRLAGDG